MILYEKQSAVAIVRLARPEKRNALTREMLDALTQIFDTLREPEAVRAVILTGDGEAFSAGTDIAELTLLDAEGAHAAAERGQRVCALIEACPVPVIAAICGAAAGGGCEIALACHLRVASSDARFSLPELKLGMIPAYGGTQRLARAAGSARAFAMMLAGETLTAGEMLRAGLLNRIVESPADVVPESLQLAHAIMHHAPLAVRAALEAVTRGVGMTMDDGLRLEAELFSRLFSTADVREGTRAFLEKRAPVFNGR